MPIDYILNAFATLFVTIDPVGLAPLVLALTAGAAQRCAVPWPCAPRSSPFSC